MSTLPTLSEATIRQRASDDSFSRGREYAREGAVGGLVRRGDQLQAEVMGSQYEPYRVRVTFDAGGLTDAACTCPYDRGGWCKHIVAMLLTSLDHPEIVETRPALPEVLAGLDRDQLQALLLGLAEREPDLADLIEAQVVAMTAAPASVSPAVPAAAPAEPRPTVDTRSLRREVRSILTPPRYGYEYGYASSAAEELRQLLRQQVQPFIDGGDGSNALRLLEAIADEYVPNWYEIDDSDGDLGEVANDLARALTEALLTADLTPAERTAWASRLEAWQAEADDYGVGDGFDMARAVAEQGWEAPALRRVLRGEAAGQGLWTGERPAYADDLARLRLAVLERQGRLEEYLNLARAEGQGQAYAVMLARLGRVAEAVEAGRRLDAAGEALALAQALRERGELEPAVQIAEQGLTLAEPRAPLATWLTDLAEGLGRRELALRAAEAAFRSAPSLSGYLKARELAGADWPALQAMLLDHLRAIRSSWIAADARVDVFLHEGLIDDAIAVVKDSSYSYDLLERVMDAAIPHRPAWVIAAARGQAERIMDAGKADRYHYAIEWLRRARDAYRAAERAGEWQQYLAALKEQHGRKYKLVGLMKQL